MLKGFTISELLVASSIAIFVIGGAFALWFMTQNIWKNERIKSNILQELQVSIERIKREIKISDGGKMFFHTGLSGSYDAISLPLALDDGRSDTGYSSAQNGDGFIETDSSTTDPITGVAKIWWDKTIIYHVYNTGGKYELRRTEFYPRNNTLTQTVRQDQIDKVVSLGTGNDLTVPEYSNWQSTRTIFTAKSISLEAVPKLREFDGYSSVTGKTENLIDFGSTILNGGYHTIKFKVVGQNISSGGFAFGIDSLKFTPPGSTREAENYINLTHPDSSQGIAGSSGDAITKVNMHNSPLGLWSADYYLDYAADAITDYLTLRFYYDKWYETTFVDGVSDNVAVEFSNTNGRGGVSGDEEWLVRLEGKGKVWDAATQTQNSTSVSEATSNVTYRNLLMAKYALSNGRMLSVKFRAGDDNPLIINSAYIIQKDDSGSGTEDDGSSDMPSIPITFNNCGLDPRNTGQTTLPTPIDSYPGNGYEGVQIPAGEYVWSNWIQLSDNAGIPFNFDKSKDYFISFYIPVAPASSISYWQDLASSPKTHSYKRIDERGVTGQAKWDDVATWGGTGIVQTSIYGVEELDVTYVNAGSFSSKVFDTGVNDPAYGTMKWRAAVNNPDAALQIKLRSSDSGETLAADSDWSSVPGQTFTISSDTGSVSLSGSSSIGTGRYVQFRADFTAIPSDGDASHITNDTDDTYPGDEDYDLSCVLKDISIYWPGNTAMVDVGGHFTKKSNYGIFSVEIDGQKLTKGFVIKLSIAEDLLTGTTVDRSIMAEVEPRNTGK